MRLTWTPKGKRKGEDSIGRRKRGEELTMLERERTKGICFFEI